MTADELAAKVCPCCGLHPYDFTVDEYKRELDRVERERDEYQGQWQTALSTLGEKIVRLQRERDEAQEALRQLEKRTQSAVPCNDLECCMGGPHIHWGTK